MPRSQRLHREDDAPPLMARSLLKTEMSVTAAGHVDETTRHLASALAAALARREQASPAFIDHVNWAIAAQADFVRNARRPARGGLAPWQQKRATELLTSNLDGEVLLAKVAKECRLSTSHFTRAFRASMGLPPHQWLVHRRIEAAKDMLRNSDRSLSEVAIACGFADQSHFTRMFARRCGVSPGSWRRRHAVGPSLPRSPSLEIGSMRSLLSFSSDDRRMATPHNRPILATNRL